MRSEQADSAYVAFLCAASHTTRSSGAAHKGLRQEDGSAWSDLYGVKDSCDRANPCMTGTGQAKELMTWRVLVQGKVGTGFASKGQSVSTSYRQQPKRFCMTMPARPSHRPCSKSSMPAGKVEAEYRLQPLQGNGCLALIWSVSSRTHLAT